MESLSKMFAIILALTIFILGPLFYAAAKQDQINQNYVYDCTVKFVDMIRVNGYLSETAYQSFCNQISTTGNVYEVELIHAHEQLNPIYDDELKSTGEYSVVEQCFYTEDIIEQLETGNQIYYFTQGDYISVRLFNVNESLGGRIQHLITRTAKEGGQIYVTYGGMIRDENY